MEEIQTIESEPKYVCRNCFPERTDMSIFIVEFGITEVLGLPEYDLFNWMPNIKLGPKVTIGEMVMKKAYCKRCHTKMGQYIISYPRDEHPEFGAVLPETYSISTKKLLVWNDGRFFQGYYGEIPYDGDAGDEIGDSDSEDGSHIPPGGINSEDDVAGEETGEGDANEEGDIEKVDDIGKGDATGETDGPGKGVDAGETNVAGEGRINMEEIETSETESKYVCRNCFPKRTDMGIFIVEFGIAEVLGQPEYSLFDWMPNIKLGPRITVGEMVLKKAYCKRCHIKMGQYIISYPEDDHPEFGVVLPKTYSISTRKLLVWDDGSFFQGYYGEIPYNGDAGDEIGDSDSEDGSHIPPGGINSEDDVAGEEPGEGDANGEGDIEKGDDIGKGDAAGNEVDAGETDVAGKGVDVAGKGIDAAGKGVDAAGKGIDAAGKGVDAGETMVAWKGVDVAGEGVDVAGEGVDAGETNFAGEGDA